MTEIYLTPGDGDERERERDIYIYIHAENYVIKASPNFYLCLGWDSGTPGHLFCLRVTSAMVPCLWSLTQVQSDTWMQSWPCQQHSAAMKIMKVVLVSQSPSVCDAQLQCRLVKPDCYHSAGPVL